MVFLPLGLMSHDLLGLRCHFSAGVTLFSCHIHLQWGRRPCGEGFSPMLLIYQGSEHKLRRKQHCFIQINYIPEEENV